MVNDPSPEEYIAADGWFTLLGLGFGLLVAIVAWLVLRRDRGPFLLLGVVAGTLGGRLAGCAVGGRDDRPRRLRALAGDARRRAPPTWRRPRCTRSGPRWCRRSRRRSC